MDNAIKSKINEGLKKLTPAPEVLKSIYKILVATTCTTLVFTGCCFILEMANLPEAQVPKEAGEIFALTTIAGLFLSDALNTVVEKLESSGIDRRIAVSKKSRV